MRTMGTAWAAAAAVAMLACLPACTPMTVKETRQTSVRYEAGAGLEVATHNGGITVERGGIDTITIVAEVRAQSRERLEATHVRVDRGEGADVRIGIDWPDGRPLSNEGCALTITIPDTARLDLAASNGTLRATGLSGPARLETSNGRIEIARHTGDLNARTSNGRIVVETRGGVIARTSNGRIEAQAAGPVDAGTSNGSVTVTQNDPASRVDIETSNGSVTLTLPAGFGGPVALVTSNGSIRTVLPAGVTTSRPDEDTMRIDLGPGAGARVETSNGSISLTIASETP